MDTHQRAMWESMFSEIQRLRSGDLSPSKLVADLRGLFVEADPHDAATRSDFEAMWSSIDGEDELRTESWAAEGAAREENLAAALTRFTDWVSGVLVADPFDQHG